MTLDIQTFLEKYISLNEKFILACSAGPDSMFLLYEILKTPYRKNLVVAYFNHKTRPETNDEEAFLQQLGKKEDFIVEVAECDFEKIQKLHPSKSFEELAREKRYQFFDALLHIHNANYVLTAHHLDDKIETFFFNLIRGSKLTGLINMTEFSGCLLRPLLQIEKAKILEYLNTNHLPYFIDSTNTDTNITRNKLRLDILPLFEGINSNYKGNISNLMNYLEEVKEYVDIEVKNFLGEESFIDIPAFQSVSVFLQKEIIRYIYSIRNHNSTIGLSQGNIAEIIRFISGKNNKTVKEIHGLKMKKENTKIYF